MKTMVRQVTRAPKLGLLLSAICLGALIAFGAVLSPTVANGEDGLPSCPAGETASWTNCQGTSTYPNGGTYVGEFRDGKPNGLGTLTYRHHGEYVGEFRDGWPSGRGAYVYPDGRRYVGEWRNGDFNGRGIRTYPDGRKEDGEWSGGEFVKSAEENSPLFDAPRNPPGGDCRCERDQPVKARRFDRKRDFWRRRAASDGVSRHWSCHRGHFWPEGRTSVRGPINCCPRTS